MNIRHLRRILGAVMGLVLLAAGPLGGTAGPTAGPQLSVGVLRAAQSSAIQSQPGELAAISSYSALSSPAPCADNAYNLIGPRWRTTYRWYFRSGTTPSGLDRAAVRDALRRGVNNIVNARNNCGRSDRVTATARYLGTTSRKANCRLRDGYNVVGFRSLSAGMLARACYWWSGGRMIEADVQFNSDVRWTTSLAGCVNRFMIEAVMTHEAGHVFGLEHVGERRHGRLTMSTMIDGPCQNQESRLGLGDMLGLEKLYP